MPSPESSPAVLSPDPVVLFRDHCLAAVYKPSGLMVHRAAWARRDPALLQWLRDRLGQYVFPVHRLDRGASGVMLFALSPEAARSLCDQFRGHSVQKTYLAMVRGWPETEGIIDHPLRTGRRGEERPAVTAYRCLRRAELPWPCGTFPTSRYALLELQPQSGRLHQLRRHLKHISHPIIGDTGYGDGRHNRLFRDHLGLCRLLLQAVRLDARHPHSGDTLSVSCPPDEELLRAVSGVLPSSRQD